MAAVSRNNSIAIVLALELQVISNQWVSNQFGERSLITDLLITDYFRCYAGNLSKQEYD
jgi:hypothetical protein